MKALRFSKFGLPSVLRIEEIPRPEPRDGEALVKVKAAAFMRVRKKSHRCAIALVDRGTKLSGMKASCSVHNQIGGMLCGLSV